jgi:hypothetical protein
MHELDMICGACGQPIEGDSGHLYAPFDEIRIGSDTGGMRQALALETVITAPKPIHWRARHFECTEHEICDVYQIEAGQIRTWAKLTEWTAHLMRKTWFPRSDWAALLMSVATGRPGPLVQASTRAGV